MFPSIIIDEDPVAGGASASGYFYIGRTAATYEYPHEYGHDGFGYVLCDEYELPNMPSACKGADRCRNLDDIPSNRKWKDFIPTAPYEGGSYCTQGIWRPTDRSIMRDTYYPHFDALGYEVMKKGFGRKEAVKKIAKEYGALTLGMVTIPFNVEGTRIDKAKEGLLRLTKECDSVIVVDNNRLRQIAGNLPLRDAFGVANDHIGSFIKGMSEAISMPGHMNLDFADMKAIMKDGGVCAIGFGEGTGDSKVEDAVAKALDSQLLDIGDIRKTKGALIHIEGGEDMTLEDVNRAGELVLEKVSPSANVTWGAMVDRDLKDQVRATIVLAGVESPFLKEKPKGKSKPKETPKVIAKKSGKVSKKTLKVSRSSTKKAKA